MNKQPGECSKVLPHQWKLNKCRKNVQKLKKHWLHGFCIYVGLSKFCFPIPLNLIATVNGESWLSYREIKKESHWNESTGERFHEKAACKHFTSIEQTEKGLHLFNLHQPNTTGHQFNI